MFVVDASSSPTAEPAALKKEYEKLKKAFDDVIKERDAITKERDAITKKFDDARKERDDTNQNLAHVIEANDDLKKQFQGRKTNYMQIDYNLVKS